MFGRKLAVAGIAASALAPSVALACMGDGSGGAPVGFTAESGRVAANSRRPAAGAIAEWVASAVCCSPCQEQGTR
jgi:hypothetical protein